MLRNYLIMAFRTFSKQKLHTTINILGLSVGLASAILIFLYIHSELGFDAVFPKPAQTYRLALRITDAQGNINYDPTMPGGWGKRMKADLAEVTEDFKYLWIGYPTSVREKDTENILLTEELYWVEPDIYKIMYFPMIKGNPETALQDPNSLVLTETAARELFGGAEPMGKEVLIKHPFITGNVEMLVTVTGVVSDYPENTSFRTKYFLNYHGLKPYLNFGPNGSFEQFEDNMTGGPWALYIQTTEGADEEKVRRYLSDLKDEVIAENPQVREQLAGGSVDVILRNVRDIHFDKDVQWVNEGSGDILYVYIFAGVALLIIIVACINYMNLATARSARRSKEIGLRKSLGSVRGQLIMQFMMESFLMVFAAFVMSLVLVAVFLPVFNAIAGKGIVFSDLLHPQLIAMMIGLLLFVALVSGAYPAFFVSGFNTILVLKGRFSFTRGSRTLRTALTGFQFAVALFLLMLTIVVVRQMDLLQGSRLNAGGDQIISIRHGGSADLRRYQAFKNAVMQDPELQQVTLCNHLPRLDYFGPLQTPYKFPEINEEEYNWNTFNVDYDFPATFGLELVAGRFFELGNVSDSTSIILNETAVRSLGKTPDEIVGTTMSAPHVNGYFDYNYERLRNGRVIGVVKDFPYKSAYQAIEPLVIDPTPHSIDRILYVKLPKGKFQEKLAFIEQKWKEVYPGVGLDYWFVSDEFGRMYKAEKRIAGLSRNFAGLAIFITCIGLFGLASFICEQRTKEIGIRKALGATNGQILGLLLLMFLKLLLFAAVVAVPLAYITSGKLLETFVYRVPLNPDTGFIGVGVIALLTIFTVGYESLKASMVNPVNSLRYE
ncbi:MAG: ABC transporter permease [Cyclobacteriaceae bacterium]|nr:ABC transporter permease [Cyclobacteriaceae bacterium]